MITFFISDLHLDVSQPGITALFLKFLETIKSHEQQVEALYILGDLFEVWIGDDNLTAFNKEIIAALKQVSEKNQVICDARQSRFFIGSAIYDCNRRHFFTRSDYYPFK